METLFLDMAVDAWGTPPRDGQPPEVHGAPQPGELYDLAATSTMLANGAVWACHPETEPELAPVAAILRY